MSWWCTSNEYPQHIWGEVLRPVFMEKKWNTSNSVYNVFFPEETKEYSCLSRAVIFILKITHSPWAKLPIRLGLSKYFSYFSMKIYVVGTHWNHPVGEIRKLSILPGWKKSFLSWAVPWVPKVWIFFLFVHTNSAFSLRGGRRLNCLLLSQRGLLLLSLV